MTCEEARHLGENSSSDRRFSESGLIAWIEPLLPLLTRGVCGGAKRG